MMWLVVFRILFVLYLAGPTVIWARYAENDFDYRCARARFEQMDHERACIAEQIDEAEFESDANGTLWNLPTAEPMVYLVRQFAIKYCPKVNRAIHCMRLRYNVPDMCLSQFQKEEHYLRTEILAEILKMFCVDNAQKLLQLLQHNGVATIYNNDVVFGCLFLIEKYPFVDETAYPYRMNQEFCDGLQEAYECYIDYVDMHANQDLWKIADEAHGIARTILNCPMY